MKKNICKIDIHSHILPVDHGSTCDMETEYMLKQAFENNVSKIVCTAHYFSENYDESFNKISKIAKKYNIRLYKGNEILITDIDYSNIKSINETNYYLIEIERCNKIPFKEIKEKLNNFLKQNKKIIFAHPELVNLTIKQIKELKDMGVLMQIDAYSYYLKCKTFVNKMLNKNLVDIVSSDTHYTNDGYYYFDKFYLEIIKRYGLNRAIKLFYDNPRKILYKKELK